MKKSLLLLTCIVLTAFTPSNVHALCIGCGCQNAYHKCLDGIGACTFDGWTDPECCRDLRNDCHDCGPGMLICFRFSVRGDRPMDVRMGWDAFQKSGAYALLKDKIEPVRPIIDKVLAKENLTEEDYTKLAEVDNLTIDTDIDFSNPEKPSTNTTLFIILAFIAGMLSFYLLFKMKKR